MRAAFENQEAAQCWFRVVTCEVCLLLHQLLLQFVDVLVVVLAVAVAVAFVVSWLLQLVVVVVVRCCCIREDCVLL